MEFSSLLLWRAGCAIGIEQRDSHLVPDRLARSGWVACRPPTGSLATRLRIAVQPYRYVCFRQNAGRLHRLGRHSPVARRASTCRDRARYRSGTSRRLGAQARRKDILQPAQTSSTTRRQWAGLIAFGVHILQHGLVERQVGDDPLLSVVLFFQSVQMQDLERRRLAVTPSSCRTSWPRCPPCGTPRPAPSLPRPDAK